MLSLLLRLFIVIVAFLILPLFVSTQACAQERWQSSEEPGQSSEERVQSLQVRQSLSVGLGLLQEGKIGEARQEFQHTLELDPGCFEAYNNIGLTYYRSGDLNKAAENYMKALDMEPVFVPTITNLGAVRHQQKQLKKATNLYRLALKLSQGKDPDIQYNLANVLRDQKDYKGAQEHYLQAIKLKPDFHAAHNGLGATYYCLGRMDEAEKEIRAALKLKPEYALAYYHLGLIEKARKNYKEAIEAYESSLKYEENKQFADDTRSRIEEIKNLMREKERPAVTTAVQPPGDAKSVFNFFGGTKSGGGTPPTIDKNDFKRAAGELESRLKGNPDNAAVLWNNFGLALLHQRDPETLDKAVKAFKRACELSKGNLYQANYNLAQARKAQGSTSSAEEECLKAIKSAQAQNQVCPLAHNLRAMILKDNGKLAKADEEYLCAIHQSTGKYPVFHYNRALLLEKLNQTREAKKEYKTYLEYAPHGLNAERAKMRLGLLNMEASMR